MEGDLTNERGALVAALFLMEHSPEWVLLDNICFARVFTGVYTAAYCNRPGISFLSLRLDPGMRTWRLASVYHNPATRAVDNTVLLLSGPGQVGNPCFSTGWPSELEFKPFYPSWTKIHACAPALTLYIGKDAYHLKQTGGASSREYRASAKGGFIYLRLKVTGWCIVRSNGSIMAFADGDFLDPTLVFWTNANHYIIFDTVRIVDPSIRPHFLEVYTLPWIGLDSTVVFGFLIDVGMYISDAMPGARIRVNDQHRWVIERVDADGNWITSLLGTPNTVHPADPQIRWHDLDEKEEGRVDIRLIHAE